MKLEFRHIFLMFIACLMIAGYFWPGELWAFSNPYFLPLWAQIIFWALFLSLFFSETINMLAEAAGLFGKAFLRNSNFYKAFGVFVLSTIFIFALRSRSYLWGDSHLFTGIIAKFPNTESLSWYHFLTASIWRHLASAISLLTRLPLEIRASSTSVVLEIINALLGGAYIAICHSFSAKIKTELARKTLVFLALVFSGGLLLFTHLEFYSLPYLIAFWGITELFLAMQNNTFSILGFLLIGIAIVLNPFLIFLVLALTLFLDNKKYRVLITAISIGVLALYHLLGILSEMPFESEFLLFTNPAHFGDITFWLNLFGFIFVASPAFAAIFIRKRFSRRIDIFRWLFIPALTILFLLELDYGALDWDFAVIILLPLSFASAIALIEIDRREAIALASLVILITGSWLYLNVDLSRGQRKGEITLLAQETGYFERKPHELRLAQIYFNNPQHMKRYYKIRYWSEKCIDKNDHMPMPYIYLISASKLMDKPQTAAWYALRGYELADTDPWFISVVISLLTAENNPEIEKVMRVIEAGEAEQLQFIGFPVNESLENMLVRLSDTSVALPDYKTGGLTTALHAAAYINYSSIAFDSIYTRRIYIGAKRLFPYTSSIYTNWGIALLKYKRFQQAREAFTRAREVGGYAGNYYNNIASVCFAEANYECVFTFLDSALAVDSLDFDYNRNYAAALFVTGKADSAIAYIENYSNRLDYKRAEKALLYSEKLKDAKTRR